MLKTATLIVSALLIVSTSGHSLAEPNRMPNEDAKQLFEKRRSLEMTSHQERIRILKEADTCIKQAPDFQAYRQCEEKEQQARRELRDQLRPQLESLHAEVQALRATHRGEERKN